MSLPPVEAMIHVGGIEDSIKAIDKLDARLAQLEASNARGAAKGAKARKTEAEKAAKEEENIAKKAAATHQKSEDKITQQKRKFHNRLIKEQERADKATDRARETFVKGWQRDQAKQRKDRIDGFKTAQARGPGLAGQAAGAVGVFAGVVAATAFLGAIGIATDALKQFGGFIITDIIGAQVKIGTKSTQIGNQIGASRGAVRGTINALSAGSISSDETVQSVFSTAAGITGNLSHARQVSRASLELADSFGLDAPSMSKFLAQRRRAMPTLDEDQFNDLSVLQFRRLQDPKTRGDFGKIAEMGGLIDTFAGNFAETDAGKARHVIGLTGLLGYASTKGKGEGFDDMIRQTMGDLTEKNSGITKIPGTNQIRSFDQILPTLMQQHGGNAQSFKAQGYGEGTRKLLFETLGLDKIYQGAERTKKGSGKGAVEEFLKDIMAVKGSRSLEEEKKNLAEDPGAQWEMFVKRIKAILIEKLLPIFEEQIVPKLQEFAPKIEKFIEKFAEIASKIDAIAIVEVVAAMAKGLAGALYHILNIASKIPGVDIDKDSLEALRVAAGAKTTTEMLVGKEGDRSEAIFDTATTALMLSPTPLAAIAAGMKGVAALIRNKPLKTAVGRLGGNQALDEEFARNYDPSAGGGIGSSSADLIKALKDNTEVTRENSSTSAGKGPGDLARQTTILNRAVVP